MNRTYLHRCVMIAMAATSAVQASAQSQAANQPQTTAIELQPITIMGNEINDIDDTLPNVDVINLNTLRNPSVTSLREAVQNNPAVEINVDGSGNADQLRIRGFGENFTEVTLDGEKLPSYFRFGGNVSGTRDFIEVDTLKQIDIVKGLHSPKQSSGALAGSVNLQTYNPSDLVDADQPFFGSVKASYTSKNKGIGGTAVAAAAKDNLSGMLIYTHRRYHEMENMGSDATQTLHNKQNNYQHNILAKGEIALESGEVILTGEYNHQRHHVEPRYASGRTKQIPPAYTNYTKRGRVKAEGHFYDVWGLDKADIQASASHYAQDSNTHFGLNEFKQNNVNIQFDGNKHFDFGDLQHNVLFGAGFDHNTFDYLLSTPRGASRYLPVVTRNTFSAYAKDQITFANGLRVSPGLRIEHQRLSSEADDAYRRNPAFPAQQGYLPNGNTTTVSPSINVAMPIGDKTEVFASYARGVKLADDGNIGSVSHPPVPGLGSFYVLPNPDLKTEKSHNYELGFSYVDPEQFELKLTGFYTRYSDFIDYKIDGTFGVQEDGRPKSIMRPFNVKKAKTYGLELETGYAINPQLYAHAALVWMRGKVGDEASHGVSLAQAYPMKAVMGLDYNQDDLWGASVDWTVVGKGQKPSKKTQFQTPGYGVVDVTGWWKPIDNLTITGGIYNLANKKYWLSSDVNGQSAFDRSGKPINLDNYTQPGRNFAVNLRYDF